MVILMAIFVNVVLPLLIVLTMHLWIGKYPCDWKTEKNSWREISGVVVLWFLATATTSYFTLTRLPEELAIPTVAVQLNHMVYAITPWLILPLVYVVIIQRWNKVDLGITWPKSWSLTVFSVMLFAIAGILPMLEEEFVPLPWSFLVLAVYQPAFIEEFFFRVILQGKLERALNPTKAWFWSGILFGLTHVPVDFFGPQFYAHGESTSNSAFLLLMQIISGWMFGIIYSKTRSIFPGMIAHFLTDGRLASVVMHISSV